MATLVLVRHGLSEYNKIGIWAGWEDPELAPEGVEQAKKTGEELSDLHFDYAYVSDLKRALHTLDEIKKQINQDPPTEVDKALRERNYGDYNHKNKWQVKDELGEEEFMKLRRSWDYPPPNGESLKMVYERVIPYYESHILPKIKDGKNVIVSSSGNALRALVKYIEGLSDQDVVELEIGTGEAYVYQINADGSVESKEIRGENKNKGKV